jgi:hypothetical protein
MVFLPLCPLLYFGVSNYIIGYQEDKGSNKKYFTAVLDIKVAVNHMVVSLITTVINLITMAQSLLTRSG